MGRIIDRLFGNTPAPKPATDYGFKACSSCTTTHTSGCSTIDAELLERYPQLAALRGRPEFQAKLAAVRKIALGD